MNNRVTYVTGDCDWQGLYVNGELMLQGHSLRLMDVLEIVHKFPTFMINHVTVDADWMEEEGYLPENEKDLVLV